PVTVTPGSHIEDAARLMHDRKVRALPVVSEETGEVEGIITETDVLAFLIEVMGLDTESARLELVL
ncbi:MAG: CBS domain-containing protein, partial [Anaerolineae bacterium]|nr:CBS domain-containing protein [Anaerolineae bacterium]